MLKKRAGHGMTLLEFLVMLAAIVILTVAAVPSFVTIVKNYRISAQAEYLYYTLQYARSEAVKRNATVYVSFVTGDSWCYGVNVGATCNCASAGSCGLLTKSADAPQRISLSASGYTNNVRFEGTHGAANISGSLTLTLYGESSLITIQIGRLGNMQVCSTGISGYAAC